MHVPDGETQLLRVRILSVSFAARDTGFHVLRCTTEDGREITCAGVIPFPVQAGNALRLEGGFEVHERHGRQFNIRSVCSEVPATPEGIASYLAARKVRGIGKRTATSIVARLGLDALDIIRTDAAWCSRTPGVGVKRAQALTEAVLRDVAAEAVFVRLAALGVSPSLSRAVHEVFGASSLALLEHDPWALARRVRGFGFRRADEIAQRMGMPLDAPSRLAAALDHGLEEALRHGHSALPPRELLQECTRLTQVIKPLLLDSLRQHVTKGEVLLQSCDQKTLVFSALMARAEMDASQALRGLAARGMRHEAPDALGGDWTPEQRLALRSLAAARLGVLTGGPGTGKTTVLRELVHWHEASGRKIALASPTGRAARRLAETSGHEATTLHRLLGITPESWNPAPDSLADIDLLIIDESSMLDLQLLACVMRALPKSASLLLVGDVDQLPSIGPGTVLRDLINSGLATVARLTEVHRQAAGNSIIANCHRVLLGEMPHWDAHTGNTFLMKRPDPTRGAETIGELVLRRLPGKLGLDPTRDIQILTPMHRGPAGTVALNKLIQQGLHPQAPQVNCGEHALSPGDRVISMRNDHEREVMNGDIGIVTTVQPRDRIVRAEFNGHVHEWSGAALGDLAPAFAITVHKAQGSEYPCVVLALFTEHALMLRRHLLYTAMSRARQHLIVVGEESALRTAVADARLARRYGLLEERLRGLEIRTLDASAAGLEQLPD